MKSRSSFETKVLISFAAAVIVVAGLAAATWKVMEDAAEAAHWVAHTHEVLTSLSRTRGDSLQIELSTQSYRISGDTARLTERDAAIAAREATLRRIKQLTADNARQQARWTRLREVIDERLAISRRTELLRKTQGLAAANAYVASAPLAETRERMFQLLREMKEDELWLLENRNAGQLRERQITVAVGALFALSLFALLIATYVLIRRQLRENEASQRALAENEQSLATTLHSIGDAVLATDTEGRITRMNLVAERLTGWSLAEAQGRPVDEVFRIVHEETRAPAEIPVAKVLETGEIQGLANHTALIARDGSERPVADSAAPVRDATGAVSGVVLVFRDVSAERQAERTIRAQNELLEQRVRERTAQLHESEAHLRSVTNNVPALIAYVDAQQRYVYVNHQYRERFAPGQTDIVGRTVREILGDARYATAAPLIVKALQGQPQSYDWQPFPGVWHVVNYVPNCDAQDQVVGYYVLISDITERKQAETALRQSEERFRLLVEGAKDYAIIMLDPQGHVVTWNEGARRLKGYAEAEIIGQPMECFYPPEDVAAGKPARLLAQAEAEGRCEDEGWRVRKDGTRFFADVILTAIRNPAGELVGFSKITRDITERKRAEQLRALSRRVLESVVDRHPLAEVLERLVREVEQITPGMLGSILLLDEDGVHVRYGAAPSLPEAYNRAIDGAVIGPSAGSCGTAAWRREPVIVTDIAADPLWADYRDLALAHGLRACWSTPILNSAGGVLGTFAMYYREPRAPSHEHHELIGHVTSLATVVIERVRDEEKIQTLNTELEQRVHELERVSRALRTLSAGNRTLLRATDEQCLLDSMCQAIVEAGGYHLALVCYRTDNETRSLRPMAATGYPGGLAALLQTPWADNAPGRGILDAAIRTGQPSVVRNMLTDPDYAAWQSYLKGNASGIAYPLRVDDEVIGTLAIFAAEPDAFGVDEVKLLTESADDLAFGIATLRARAEQQKTQAALHRLSHFDALTGLPNETRFTELLADAVDAGKQMKQSFAVLQTNIKRLREINDALGFSHGDQLLREFGARLSSVVPESAIVARLRGDEFAILLPDSNANAAIDMVRRMTDVLARPFQIADIALDVAAKTGIALFPEHGSTIHDLFRHMDMAVQRAKEKSVEHAVFDPAQNNQDQSRRLTMAGELRRAIEGGDLLLYLQPKVEFATGRVCGAEGLVRWKHAERGLIPPGEFIGLAEHTGLIKPLTEWVIEAGLRLNHAWQREGCALPIAVNLSARNLREGELLEIIRHMQAEWGVAAGLLEMEITESTVMDDAEFALRVLHRLRDEGIPLYIDDFGTGYSSLGYLQKLPVEYIKIDQSFVRDMSTSKDSARIVRSTIDLVHDLGRKVVAEGIETQEHWDQLAALGCDIAQGYFIAKPMPAEEFQSWVGQFRSPVTTPSGKG